MTSKSAQKQASRKTESDHLKRDDHLREEHIATAAYFKAQARGFAHGHELHDWLQAEAEYETRRRHA
jgi:hypothetical protein